MSEPFILEARSLVKEFAGFVAVNDVSLRVERGTIHGLIGPNGAGKTTCFNLISKFLGPTSGRIFYKGRDITRSTPAALARQGLCRSFQISAVFPKLTVLDNVRVALQRKLGLGLQFWRGIRCLDGLNEPASELLEAVGLSAYRNQPTGELSYGRKRALELATTLALDPEVMLLDEPTSGLGHEDIPQVCNLIRSAAKGRTVLMVEHNLSVVAELCNRITVLQRGEVLAEGSYDEISRNQDVVVAYLGGGNG
ncbi:MAG: ABC transporter ATP-binding protein [Parvibaculaceae bacterium]